MKEVNYMHEESENYDVFVNGTKKKVYDTQVLFEPINITKHLYHPYIVSYVILESEDETELTIVPKYTEKIDDVKVQPKSKNILYENTGDAVRIKSDSDCKFCVTINGDENRMLIVIVNKPVQIPSGDDVIYFGPGEHFVDDNENNKLVIESGQTIYLADGAVLHGKIWAEDCKDISIIGNGIICGTYNNGRWADSMRGKIGIRDTVSRGNLFVIKNCENVAFKNCTVIDSDGWNLELLSCRNVDVEKINIIGYQANSDGIDICSSADVRVNGVFIRTSDDCIVLKTLDNYPECCNIDVSHCILWADRANALEIGHEVAGGDIHEVRFYDIDILNQFEDTYGYHAIDIANVDKGAVYNVAYENIRVENCVRAIGVRIREGIFSSEATKGICGQVHDISFKNIYFADKKAVVLSGRDLEHMIYNITFENIYMSGKKLTDTDDFYCNVFVKNVEIKEYDRKIAEFAGYPSADKCVTLDIRQMCNLLLEDGGGIYGLQSKDWLNMPSGINVWEGIPFNITGQGYALDGDYKLAAVPEQRMVVQVPPVLDTDINAQWLFFLQTGINVIGNSNKILGKYIITYSDGTNEEIKIRNKNDCDDWQTWSTGGWQPTHKSIKMYVMPWRNPNPNKRIKKIELKDGEIHAMPMLLAITYV